MTRRAIGVWAWLGFISTTFSLGIALYLNTNALAAFPAPGDLPSARDRFSVRVTPSTASPGQVVAVEVAGSHSIAYSIDERVDGRWVKRYEGGGFGCGISDAQRAQERTFFELGCEMGGDEVLPDTRVRLPDMLDGTYRLRTTFHADPLARQQFELASTFTVDWYS